MKVMTFDTDAAAVAGTGAERLSGQGQIPVASLGARGIRILALKQAAGAVLANDADWNLWVNFKDTGMLFTAESLDPVNDGGVKLGPRGITISPKSTMMWLWQAQAAAQANALQIYYEPV